MFVPVLLSVTLVVTLVTSVGGQSCSGQYPPPNILADRGRQQNERSKTIIVTEKGRIDCYGRVHQWQFRRRTFCDKIRFQIWRPQPGGNYMLVGENIYDTCAVIVGYQTVTLPIDPLDRISVRPDDVIGWHVETNQGMLVYDDGLPGSTARGEIRSNPTTCVGPGIGTTCNFNDVQRRDYSVQAHIEQDDIPTITNLPATTRVAEDVAAGTPVFTVHAHPRNTWGQSVLHDVRYRIPNSNPVNCENAFNLDPNTGLITFVSTGVNKAFLQNSRNCQLRIETTMDDRQYSGPQNLDVTIEGANHPHNIDIASLPFIASIDASVVTMNRLVHTINVLDTFDEAAPTGVLTDKNFFSNSADPDASIFDLTRTTRNRCEVRCNADIRYKTSPTKYILNITASDDLYTDGPRSLQVDVVNLRIPPHLKTPPGSATLKENDTGPRNNWIGIDADVDPLGAYNYEMVQYPRNETTWFSLNTIGPRFISLNAGVSFDYKRTKKYELQVTIRDARMGYSDVANLTVEIIRVNKEPQFTVTGPVRATMPEEMAIHSPVPGLNLTVYDRDIEFGDTFSLRILPGGTNSQFFYTKVGSTQLFVNQRMDVDPNTEKITATFNVQVRDQAGTSKNPEGTVSVSIDVTDINDNAPVFTQSSFSGSIVENTNGTHTVGTFTATDRDWGQNAAIFYTIQNNATGARGNYYFQVDPTTGELKVKHPIDREEHQEIIFRLVATDGGTPPLSGYMSVYLSVEDLNDNRPMFTKALYNTEVPSYVSTHTTVTTIVAVDPDIDSRVTYFLLVPNSNFYLSAMDGHVTTTRGLSSGTTHYLYCYARDHGVNPGELFSDPSVVRIDAFEAGDHLIDVTLNILLKDFTVTMETEFVDRLRTLLHPWLIKILRKQARNSQTVVTLYSLEDNVTDSFDNRFMIKHFVHRDSLLATMRKDIHGTPSDPLLGPDFAKFRPVHVGPTYPNWIIETVGGIATLTVILVVATALLIGGAVLAMKMLQVGPFKPKIAPTTVRKVVPADEFKLNYATEPKKVTPPVVMRPAASSVLPSRIGNRPRPPPPTFEA